MSREAAVCLNPDPNGTELRGKPRIHSGHEVEASTDCGSSLIEESRPSAQLRQRQPGRGDRLRFVAAAAVPRYLRQQATGQVLISPSNRYPGQHRFGHLTRFANVCEGTDRLDLRDGLRPATESEQDIGSGHPADRGMP
jgi:hypothetical protein